MAKTIVAMLVGVAVSERSIGSLDDPAQKYVPELAGTPYGETPIRHLLTMSSGVRFSELYTKQFEPGQTGMLYGYGYQTWILPGKERQFMLRGLRGQNVFVDPKSKVVMVHTAAGGVGDQGMGERLALWGAVVESLRK